MASDSYQSPWRKPPSVSSNSRGQSTRGSGRGTRGYIANRGSHASGRGSSHSFNTVPPERDYMEGLVQKPLQAFNIPAPPDPAHEAIKIGNCTYLASYNWLKDDGGTPVILVPGSPPQWIDKQLPYGVAADRGIYYSDQNGHRMPKAVLLPLIVAVNKMSEMTNQDRFDWRSVDMLTDRNNMRKLLRWVNGTSRDFRIDLQLAGEKTVLMTRWSERTEELFSGRTFGFEFEKASTTPAPGCSNSTGHHRIVSYDINGLKMVVRFEVDACIGPPAEKLHGGQSSVDKLTESLSAVSITETTFQCEYPLVIREVGVEVPSESIIEMATRSEWIITDRGFDWENAYPQLFFSQTAYHHLAIHDRGTFKTITKEPISSAKLQKVEKTMQPDLKKMRKALDLIQNIVIKHGKTGRLSLVCKDGVLKVYHRSSEESLLPNLVMAYFESESA